MTEQSSNSLKALIDEIESSSDQNTKTAKGLLLKHITEIGEVNASMPPETVKQIEVAMNEEGDVTIASSMKIPNIKFHLGEFLIEATSTSIALSSSLDTPIKLIITALKFMQKAKQLATVPISPKDAEVLIAIHKLTLEGEIPTVDKLLQFLNGIQDVQLAKSLEILENLSCISITMNEILLNEKIVYRNEKN